MLQNIFLEKVCIHEQLVYKKYYLSHDSFLRSTEEEDDVTSADKAVQVESTVAAVATGQQQLHPVSVVVTEEADPEEKMTSSSSRYRHNVDPAPPVRNVPIDLI